MNYDNDNNANPHTEDKQTSGHMSGPYSYEL